MKPSNIAGYYKQHGKLATAVMPGLLLTVLLANFTATATLALIAGLLVFNAAAMGSLHFRRAVSGFSLVAFVPAALIATMSLAVGIAATVQQYHEGRSLIYLTAVNFGIVLVSIAGLTILCAAIIACIKIAEVYNRRWDAWAAK